MAELKRYEPHTFATVQDVFDRLFDRSLFGTGLIANGPTPHAPRGFPSNLWETDEAFVLELAIPGVKPDDIEMTLSKGSLLIKGRYDSAEDTKGTRIWRNLPEGEFEVAYTLPAPSTPTRPASLGQTASSRCACPRRRRPSPSDSRSTSASRRR